MTMDLTTSKTYETDGQFRPVLRHVQATTKLPWQIVRGFFRWRADVHTGQALRRLSPHLLHDIGLSKADIERRYPVFPSEQPGRHHPVLMDLRR